MGVYDEYGKKGVQLKVGCCELKQYKIGEKVSIPDGVYVGHEGIIVILNGKLLAEFDHIIDKYGEIVEPVSLFHNPLEDILNQYKK